ncbi:MAG TPA: hypothetical protein VN577_15550 [Terriglobales bacterium]|nr:hypothetical protein [Terriglobales bacterium]
MTAAYANLLRHELQERNLTFSRKYGLPSQLSYGSAPVVVYEESGEVHGNFAQASYGQIRANPQWARRLRKVHTSAKSSLPRADRRWCELDSCNSSDALLMNVFCYPGVCESSAVLSMLGVEEAASPEFGFKARVPLTGERFDRTEVDLRLPGLLVEAKLTEADFQSKAKDVVEQYRDFRDVFIRRDLPQDSKKYEGYQLIRNVLAAHALQTSFCVLCDARRPDLIEQWYAVMRCVRSADLRLRCKVLTWQELSEVVPDELREFLDEKYGIRPGPIEPYVFECQRELHPIESER